MQSFAGTRRKRLAPARSPLERTRCPLAIARRPEPCTGAIRNDPGATRWSAHSARRPGIDPAATVLPFVDQELVDEFIHDLRDRGVTLRLKSKVASVERVGDACLVRLDDGRQVKAEMVLYAAGRQGATAGLALEAAGLTADAFGLTGAMWVVAAITFLSGVIVGVRMDETLQRQTA